MVLAAMIDRDEESLICDFAETYHVFDYKSLPVRLSATLAVGLPADSRIMRKLSGQKQTTEVLLLANIADALNLLVWFKTKDGQKNRNRPKSVLQSLLEEPTQYEAFDSIEAYEAARKKIMES